MSDVSADSSVTARSFLFDSSRTEAAGSVQQVLRGRGLARSTLRAYRHLSTSVAGTIDEEFGVVVDEVLELDLGDVLVSAWRIHEGLCESARRTLAAPGSEEVRVLASHRITSTYRPHVDLVLDDLLVNSFEFELLLVFDLTGIAAVVRAGNLVALRGGDCAVDASLSLEGLELARRRKRVDLALMVRLQDPIPLVDPPRRSLPVQRSSTDAGQSTTRPL